MTIQVQWNRKLKRERDASCTIDCHPQAQDCPSKISLITTPLKAPTCHLYPEIGSRWRPWRTLTSLFIKAVEELRHSKVALWRSKVASQYYLKKTNMRCKIHSLALLFSAFSPFFFLLSFTPFLALDQWLTFLGVFWSFYIEFSLFWSKCSISYNLTKKASKNLC